MKYSLKQNTMVFSAANETSQLVAELQIGTEIEVGAITKSGDEEWHDVRLPDGRVGYISAKTKGVRVGPPITPGPKKRDPRKSVRDLKIAGILFLLSLLWVVYPAILVNKGDSPILQIGTNSQGEGEGRIQNYRSYAWCFFEMGVFTGYSHAFTKGADAFDFTNPKPWMFMALFLTAAGVFVFKAGIFDSEVGLVLPTRVSESSPTRQNSQVTKTRRILSGICYIASAVSFVLALALLFLIPGYLGSEEDVSAFTTKVVVEFIALGVFFIVAAWVSKPLPINFGLLPGLLVLIVAIPAGLSTVASLMIALTIAVIGSTAGLGVSFLRR